MRRPSLRRLALFAPPLAAALLVAALGGASVLRKAESFQPLGFTAQPEGGSWRVQPEPDPATGLRAGDQILAVENLPVGPAAEVRERLLDGPTAEVLVKRGERLQRLLYRRPGVDVDVRFVVLAFAGALYLLIGLFTFYKHPRSQGALFFLWCLASAAVCLFAPQAPYDRLGKALFVGDELARLLLPPLTLHLFLVFPAPVARHRRLLAWIPFAYLPAAALATLNVDLILFDGALLLGRPTEGVLSSLDRMGIYHLVVYMVAALGALAVRFARAEELEERRQLRWISLGLGAGYLPFVLLHGVPLALSLEPPELVTSLAVLPLVLVPLTFAYALLRYKLWDIEVIVRDAISTTLTLVLGVLGFSLVNLALSRGVPEHLAQARTVLSFVAGLVIAGLLVPARRGIGASLERLQYRGAFRKRRALGELGRDLLHDRDLDHLCGGLLERLEDGMELERVNLYLAQGESLVAIRPGSGLPAEFPVSALGAREWEGEVLRLSGLDAPGRLPSPLLRLYMAGFRYAFPLVVRRSRVGVMTSGYKLEGTPLSSEDVDLVRQVLNQAALAIENARLVDQLHQRLEEVLRLKQHNEGIIESSPAGLAVLDAGGRIGSANLAFAALVGRERRRVVDAAIDEVLPLALPEPGEGPLEASYRAPDGGDRFLQLSVSLLGGGDSRQRILMIQDVTERMAIERELKEKDRLAALGMLAAGVAHEVNTPITGISSYAQMLLEETPEDDPRHGLLRKMERQTFRASRIVGSLLDFARNRRDDYRALPLAPILGEVLAEAQPRLAECGVRAVWQPPVEEMTVVGSEVELTQVFTNLVANALDAMAAEGTLTLTLGGDGERVVAAVEDTGTGIPAEQLEKVFQPFFSTKLAAGGTGLGLSISYEIVRRHGGEIRVTSTVGRGSRFEVELPRHREADR